MEGNGKMRYLKPAIGIILIILALVGGYYWETKGRQTYQQVQVPVASVDILQGDKLDGEMVKVIYLDKSSIVKGALLEKDIPQIIDYRATQFIPANSQIVASFFKKNDTSLAENKSVFSIPNSWIFSRSSTLRKGDWIEIYGEGEMLYFGKYQIAFVKDQSENEIENLEGPFIKKNILERTAGTGIIHHIELCCTLEDYCTLLEHVTKTGMGILLVQREESH